MKVLVACEMSGRVREAFRNKGHNAWSCDLLPSLLPGPHYQGDVLDILDDNWDMLIAFPPCTHLASSGARYFAQKQADGRQQDAINFFLMLANCNTIIPKVVIENPIGIMSNVFRKPDQIIQPWQFGEPESKATCLWLHGVNPLIPTNTLTKPINGRWRNQTPSGQNKLGPSSIRALQRGITYQGIANAMADQWG